MTAPLPPGLHPDASEAVLNPDRLAAVAATKLLDTDPEEEFDRLTTLTARTTGAPISIVALLDDERSYFKSAHGLPELPPGRTVGFAHSMCQHVVASGEPLVVDDTRRDPVLCENGAVTDMGAGAYLGVPLRSPAGEILGTLCAVDVEAREWTPDDVSTLLATAAAAQGEVALRAERDARHAAERMTRLKSAFLANMSHEIRTPLTAILGSAEVLNEEVPAESRDLTSSILSGGRRLMSTLNSVLDLAQIEAGQITPSPRPTDVGARIAHAAKAIGAFATVREVTVSTDVPPALPLVTLDPDLLDRILAGLVSNAVKFTERGRVGIRARIEGGDLSIAVADTGIGIAPADLEHLFDEFQQASDGHARTHEGTGLGLALVRHVATLMGGEIAVESALGEGSVFTVRIPIQAPAGGDSHAALGTASLSLG